MGFIDTGGSGGPVSLLLHGFPYDVRSFEEVAELLARRGIRSIIPFQRGFGATRLRADATVSGQQAALGQDAIDLIEALELDRPVVAGFDWGGRAACIAAAVRPELVSGLVTVGGYAIQDIDRAAEPAPPEEEHALWYQWYLNSDRGAAGLDRHRDDFCRLLWTLWSPEWTDAVRAFERSRESLHNPDFVDVVVHSYRHRHGAAAGAPRHETLERMLAAQPEITVPTISIDALADGLGVDDSAGDAALFTGGYDVLRFAGVGHDVPQEAPIAFADAVASLVDR